MIRSESKRLKDIQLKAVAEKISVKQETTPTLSWEKFRLVLKEIYFHSPIGFVFRNFLLAISLISCMRYIEHTYSDSSPQPFELFISILFTLDWFLNLIMADHKMIFLTNVYGIIDLLSVMPTFLMRNRTCPEISASNSFVEIVEFVICGLETTRILRTLRLRERFHFFQDEVQRFLANMGLNIVVFLLFNTALMKYLEPGQNLAFHTWMYYMIVTSTTVGYGDISPKSDLGRFVAMAMISFAIITVPQMTNELILKIGFQSVYARASYIPKAKNSQHVLICGNLTSSSMYDFFQELFHDDHNASHLHAVVLHPGLPNYEMMTVLKDPKFMLSVTYLEGVPLNGKDLNRARASSAMAIFIMSNKFSANPDEEDAKTILQQFSIQRHLRLNVRDQEHFDWKGINDKRSYSSRLNGDDGLHNQLSNAPFFLQLIRPENKRHLVSHDGQDLDNNIVVCLNEIKMGIIAKSSIFPGVNTLIENLLTSFSDESNDSKKETVIDGIEIIDEDSAGVDWIGEYRRGCDWEIYASELSPSFEGATFCHLSELLYQKLGIALFALEIEDLTKEKSTVQLLLNPADFEIPSNKYFRVQAFVLAKNKAQSDLSDAKQHPFLDECFRNFKYISGLQSKIASPQKIVDIAPTLEVQEDVFISPLDKKQAWQSLLRQYEATKSKEVILEEQQRREDRQLRLDYYVHSSNTIMDLNEATIKSSLTKEMPFVENHIVIIGKALSNLYDLIRPLRVKSLGELKHIIILYPYDFPLAIWQRISIFESIWIVRGSGLEEADIRRCGIFRAKQVIFLADSSSYYQNDVSQTAAANSDALTDADVIFAYQAVRRMNEHAHLVVEIVRPQNVSFLDPEYGLNSSGVNHKFTPQFASGTLFTSCMLDTFVCQAFYNTKIVEIIKQMVSDASTDMIVYEPKDNLSSSSYSNSPLPQHHQKESSKHNRKLIGSHLYQISVPKELATKTYGALYSKLVQRKMIPLGILRGVFFATKSGPKANQMPYVFTNPPKDTELFSCDKIFVLSQKPIKMIQKSKDDSADLKIYSELRQKKNTTEDVLDLLNTLRNEISSFPKSQESLDACLEELKSDVDGLFQSIIQSLVKK